MKKTAKKASVKKTVKRPVSVKKVVAKRTVVAKQAPESLLGKYLPYLIGLSFAVLFLTVIAYAVALKSTWLASQDNSFMGE